MTEKIDSKIEAATKMIELRLVQTKINESYKKGMFKVPVHLAMGHESIAVAVDSAMQKKDKLILSHRNIHYNYLKNRSYKSLLSEYLLKENGASGGCQGSMNLNNPENGIIYTSSILGNNLCVATGVALAESLKDDIGVTFVVTGDGAMEEGAFYESLVFLKSNNSPAVIIIENNEWSLATKIEERRHEIKTHNIAISVNTEHFYLSGNNIFDYITALAKARSLALEKRIPVIVEVKLTTLGHWIMTNDDNPKG
ncbi:MAG: thiamine pyrophosphate-dependent enzyme, partial [Bacteriovorax sp.]|nr:thiamine pyrophosphate-dependent enzyme [Bacteriovorax sp.]